MNKIQLLLLGIKPSVGVIIVKSSCLDVTPVIIQNLH